MINRAAQMRETYESANNDQTNKNYESNQFSEKTIWIRQDFLLFFLRKNDQMPFICKNKKIIWAISMFIRLAAMSINFNEQKNLSFLFCLNLSFFVYLLLLLCKWLKTLGGLQLNFASLKLKPLIFANAAKSYTHFT